MKVCHDLQGAHTDIPPDRESRLERLKSALDGTLRFTVIPVSAPNSHAGRFPALYGRFSPTQVGKYPHGMEKAANRLICGQNKTRHNGRVTCICFCFTAGLVPIGVQPWQVIDLPICAAPLVCWQG